MIHEFADVKSIDIGEGTNVWQYCVIFSDVKIGKNCNICAHVLMENGVVVGDNVTIKSGVQLWDGVIVEDDVFIGPNVTFSNDLYPRSKVHLEVHPKTIIRKGASIGANSTIVANRTIGEYSMIGAGSVITRDVPPYTLWYGCPASLRGYVNKSGDKISYEMYIQMINEHK